MCVCVPSHSHTEVQRDIYSTYSRFIHNLLDMMSLRAHPTTPYTPFLEAYIRIPVQGTALGRSGKGAGGSNLGHNRSNPCINTTNTVSAQLIGDCLWQCSAFSPRAPSHLSVSYSLSLKHIQILVCVCVCVCVCARARANMHARGIHTRNGGENVLLSS